MFKIECLNFEITKCSQSPISFEPTYEPTFLISPKFGRKKMNKIAIFYGVVIILWMTYF